jgi:hypothetical protein
VLRHFFDYLQLALGAELKRRKIAAKVVSPVGHTSSLAPFPVVVSHSDYD